jgi:hypothetical protein
MGIYAGLFDSMVACCGRIGLRHGPVYTVAMMALGLGVSLNILSVIDLLWTLGILNNPYLTGGGLHPQRYLCALLCIAFILNTILARHNFSVDRGSLHPALPRRATSPTAAPVYVLGSTGLFLITLSLP